MSLPLQGEEQGKRHFGLQLIPVVRRHWLRNLGFCERGINGKGNMKHVGNWPATATALLAFLVSTPAASAQLTLAGAARFESGQPVVGGTVTITELKKKFLGRFRLPKVVRTLTIATKEDGTFRIELPEIRGYLDVSLEYEICQWTGAVATVSAAEIADAEFIQVDLVTKPSVACDEE